MSVAPMNYGAFSSALHRRAATARIPLEGSLEVTHRCPLSCSHCYNNAAVGDREALQGELTLDEHRRILDELAEAGCLWLLLTGGEVFARRDFMDIYRHARRVGLLLTVFTNGTMITPEIADELAALPPFGIEITLYGHTRETYERLTGVPGSYDRCLRGIHLLLDRKLPLKLKTVALTINRHEIADMRRFAEQQLGVGFKFDAMMNPRIDCSQSPLAVRLSPEEVVAMDVGEPERTAEWTRLARLPSPAVSTQVYRCGGGVSSFAIDPEGKLSICVLSQMEKYDLRRGSFRDGWERFLLAVRQRPLTRPNKCSTCSIRLLCSSCAATSELENGDAERPVEFMCEVAHLRAHAIGHGPHEPHGDCQFCLPGPARERLLATAGRMRQGLPAQLRRPSSLKLASAPSGGAGCGSGGCGSCGADGGSG